MPTAMAEMSNENLIILAEQGSNEACFERLIRDVMRVDNLEYMDAKTVADNIRLDNRKHVVKYAFMSWLGLFSGSAALVGCVPMVFSRSTALWFNEGWVTTEVPPAEDLESIYEVGAWTWNWMEPCLGTASFMLLCVQFCRAQMVNMNFEPWTNWIRNKRAENLIRMHSKYTEDIVYDFAVTASLRPKKQNR